MPQSGRKRPIFDALSEFEETLAAHVDANNVSGVAHLELAGKMKKFYDAHEAEKAENIESYVIYTGIHFPKPTFYCQHGLKARNMVNPNFLGRLLDAKQEENNKRGLGVIDGEFYKWKESLMDGLLPDIQIASEDNLRDPGVKKTVQKMIIVILETGRNLREPLQRHLIKHNVSQRVLFPVDDPGSYKALHADGNFIAWLIADGNNYPTENTFALRLLAFESLMREPPEDFEFEEAVLKALGVHDKYKNPRDFIAMLRQISNSGSIDACLACFAQMISPACNSARITKKTVRAATL